MTTSAQRKKTGRDPPRRRRILLLAGVSYASAGRIATGVMRFVSSHPEVELLIGGTHPQNGDLEYAGETPCDGILSCMGTKSPLLRKVLKANPRSPVVFASLVGELSTVKGRPAASLRCDNAAIAAAAAGLFVRHGLRHFAYVGARSGAAGNFFDRERREGFLGALAAHGSAAAVYEPPPPPGRTARTAAGKAGKPAPASDSAALAAWLKALPKPCGVFVSYDMRAMHVLGACRAAGIAVPEAIQIVGADNEEWICENVSPSLSSVEPDFEGCGRSAAETLLALMDGESRPAVRTFGVKRVEQRMSTTDIHGSANRAGRAREYLRAHAGEPLGTARLAALFGCSARLLQQSYRTVFGRTVQDDLAEARLAMAKRLLSDRRIPVCDIPGRVGFESPGHFMQFFKARTGMTMLQWRRRGGRAFPP